MVLKMGSVHECKIADIVSFTFDNDNIYYGIYDGKVYKLDGFKSFNFRANKYYGITNGEVQELNNLTSSYTFKAGTYYGIQDGNVYKLSDIYTFKFIGNVYYGFEGGDIHKLNNISTFEFEAGIYYALENGSIHRLYPFGETPISDGLNSEFIFDEEIYYGIHNGNVYKLKLPIHIIEESSFTFSAGVYYGLESDKIHKLEISDTDISNVITDVGSPTQTPQIIDGDMVIEPIGSNFVFEDNYYGLYNGHLYKLTDQLTPEEPSGSTIIDVDNGIGDDNTNVVIDAREPILTTITFKAGVYYGFAEGDVHKLQFLDDDIYDPNNSLLSNITLDSGAKLRQYGTKNTIFMVHTLIMK